MNSLQQAYAPAQRALGRPMLARPRAMHLESTALAARSAHAATLSTRSIVAASALRRPALAAHPTAPPMTKLCAVHFASPSSVVALRRPASTSASPGSSSSQQSSGSQSGHKAEEEEEGPPKNASWRERLRFMTRRYGRWALVVYLLASAVDFSIVFACIHFLGADHIKELEARARAYLGLGKHEGEDEAHGVKNVLQSVKDAASAVDAKANNEEAARAAADYLRSGGANTTADGLTTVDDRAKQTVTSSSSMPSWLSGSLGTELVLAYTIHKTALLPFRIAVTAAVLPSFVKLMVRLGWSRPNAAIQKAARAATEKAATRKGV